MPVTRDFKTTLYKLTGMRDAYDELECAATFEAGPGGEAEIVQVAVYFGSDLVTLESGDLLWPAVMDAAEQLLVQKTTADRIRVLEIEGELMRDLRDSDFPGSDITTGQHAAVREYFAQADRPITLAKE